MKQLLLLLLCLIAFDQVEAQLFKKLKKRVSDKIERKVEDKVVEELSEEIARRAVKPLDNAFDDMFRQSYKEEYGKEYDDSEYEGDPEKQAAMMQTLLGSMYGTAELPEAYTFDYTMNIKVTDYGEKKSNDMKMYVDPSSKAFGMEQKDRGEEQIMVFDMEKDQVVIFNKKEKTAMAIPNVMKMARTFGKGAMEEAMSETVKFEKMGKSKKINGYMAEGYKVETEEDKGEYYVSTDLPFDWNDAFGGLVESISPNFYKDNPEYDIQGMMLLSEMKRKSDGKKAKWEVSDISNKTTNIKCSEYKLANMMEGR